MSIVELDNIDKKILGIIQNDATRPIQEIAEAVGLTSNPCWRRLRRLEEIGIVQKRIAVIDPAKLGLKMTCFVRIHTSQHTGDWLETFKRSVSRIPEIVECHRMTGEIDYLLKVIVRDLDHYDKVYQALIKYVPDLSDVSSSFSMERLKSGHDVNLSLIQ